MGSPPMLRNHHPLMPTDSVDAHGVIQEHTHEPLGFGAQTGKDLAQRPIHDCGVQVTYLDKRQSDQVASKMTAFPCASTFPGLPGATALPLASKTVSVSQPSWQPDSSQPLPTPSCAFKPLESSYCPAGLLLHTFFFVMFPVQVGMP